MKGIYLFGIGIILLILIGILFYYENTNFIVNTGIYSLTYVNQQQYSFYILKVYVNLTNNGFLPMSISVTNIVDAFFSVNGSVIGYPKQFTNSTSVSVAPMSKKLIIFTYYLPASLKSFSNIYVYGNGYYNYQFMKYVSGNQIIQLNSQIQTLPTPVIPKIVFNFNNLTIKGTGYIFQVYPLENTFYPNGTHSITAYLILYPNYLNIPQGTYTLEITSNSSMVYNGEITIPSSSNVFYIKLFTTPPLSKNTRYTTNVNIILENNLYRYVSNFNVSLQL